ncbi:MAG: response regulator [Desulfofustis sp.]|nr:response regulator [Desulfofustis sp.]
MKFTERGEIVVSVGVEQQRGSDLVLHFSVKDSGIGLKEEQIGSLFSAFSQADDSITRRYGGTGLGLAICKQLTELMGGTIRVESEPGRGSEFIFTARLQCPERQLSARPRLLEQLSGLRALVVDDNSIARDVLSSMLRSLKIEVDTAVDGESAIALLEQQTREGRSYDVILLDWIMPGIDGIETARRIKANAEIARIPAMLMVTANAREDAYVEAKNAGLDAFLLKPVYASIMHDTLLDIIGVETAADVSTGKQRNQQLDLDEIRGARILLVDDNIINQEVAAEFLNNVGMVVTIATNGRQALEALDKQSFDLVLMDIQMPEMDGLEATRRIRRDGRHGELPIIAMTAHAMTGDRDKSLAAGMNDHITKPIDQKVLYQTLKQWIAPTDGGAAPPAEPSAAVVADDGALPDLPGIDSEQAIRVLNGSSSLFRKMLYEFKHEYALLPTRLRELSESGQWEKIGVYAHTVKGIAGYIGAPDLGATARELEEVLKEQRRDEAGGLLMAFIDALDAVLSALSALPPLTVKKGPAGRLEDLGVDRKCELLHELIGQLERGEAAAEHLFGELREQLDGDGDDELLKKIGAAIDDIEYDDAAVLAQELLLHLTHRTEQLDEI